VRRNSAGTVLVHNPAVVGESDIAEGLVIVDGFRAGGITSDPDIVPDNATNVEERRGISHSVMRSASLEDSYWDRFLTSQTSSPQTRWRGANTGGYSNPSFERLFDSWRVTLDAEARIEREADLHKHLLDDVAYVPLFYNVDVFAHRKGVVGPKTFSGLGRNTTIDVHTWTLE
jgi:ABC-type transport system substrate-binding protein